MSFGTINMKVDGQQVKMDVDDELEVTNISQDMDKVAAKMAYWGAVWAAAAAEAERVDAHYRTWRADTGQSILASDPKMAEWKVKQAVEGDGKFMKFKEAAARAQRNSIVAKAVFESFRIKANMLQSKGAMQRSELDATSMSTRRNPREDEDAKSAMRVVNKKNKKKKQRAQA